jgi:ribosome-associated heat shock protein Hsp15
VRLNGERVSASSRPVKAGDVVTVALDRVVRILKVTGFAERRGDADAARLLCEDITPISPPRETGTACEAEASPAERNPGTGRPTKQERRATDRLLDRER